MGWGSGNLGGGGNISNKIPSFEYTGVYEIVNDNDEPISESQNNWKIRFLTSGVLTLKKLSGARNGVDIFLVGGGGGCGTAKGYHYGGGGGGYTKNQKAVSLASGVSYELTIGAGGGAGAKGGTTSFVGGVLDISASGGNSGGTTEAKYGHGGDGGSGGAPYGSHGGSDGSNGGTYSGFIGGKGQGTTTREFEESAGKLYAGGGAGGGGGEYKPGDGGGGADTKSGEPNTGGGAGGNGATTYLGQTGGSGIIVIRNARGAYYG